jgi:hypothetical protein
MTVAESLDPEVLQKKVIELRSENIYLKEQNAWLLRQIFGRKSERLVDTNHLTEILLESIQNHGSGVLSIDHPEIRGHVIVLDQISKEENTAIIRDSFHGWALTIKLDSLLSWIHKGSYFLQIRSSDQT